MIPKIIAHRGASGECPENTLAAIRVALDHNVDFIEIDVRLSKDGIPVVIHDDSLNRLTNDLHSANIHDLLSLELKEIDIGAWFGEEFIGERIPELREIFNFDWKHTGLMIEIKECAQAEFVVVEAVFNVLENAERLPPQLVIGSFSPSVIAEVQRRSFHSNVQVNCVGIVEELKFIDQFMNLGIHHLAILDKIVSLPLITSLKAQNIEVWSFTVDDLETIHLLTSMNIDGLISNHPKRLKK